MLKLSKKIFKSCKREVIFKIITSLFIQGLALTIPVFWSNTINEVTEGNYKIGYYLVLITLLLTIFYYVWLFLNQKTWYKLYNKLYTLYTNITISETKNINKVNLGEYTNILNNDIDIICNFEVNLITRFFQILEFIIIYVYFLSFNFIIFLITIIISILMFLIYIKVGKLVQKLNLERKDNLDKKTIIQHKLYTSLISKKSNISSLIDSLKKDSKSFLFSNYKYNVSVLGVIYLVLTIMEMFRYFVILYSVYLVSLGKIEIGSILLIYSYYAKIITNFEVLGTITADFRSFMVSLKRLNKITTLSYVDK